MQYAVKLVAATRDPERYGLTDMARYITFGASPRATIHLIEGARRSRSCAAATTCCRRTWSISSPTCCATGWCSPTKRCPTADRGPI